MAASLRERVPGARRVPDWGSGLCADSVTHEELRALLAPYAAGVLDDETSQAVRAHLAGGCLACLDELFAHPVGLVGIRSAFFSSQNAFAVEMFRCYGFVMLIS